MGWIQINYDSVVKYFDRRSRNASAEMKFMKIVNNLIMLTCLPQAGIKAFRNQFIGVRKVDFFLFRLTKLFA